jgi:hypothetical protein
VAKLHPLLKAKWDALGNEVHQRLFDIALTMSVPFWWHGPTPDDPEIYNNGSLCLLDTGERVIGVTAWHVHEAYLARLALRKLFVCQFGGVTVFPEQILIDKNERLDLATFNLSAVVLDLEGFTTHRPQAWPPPRAAVHDLVVYGGFPGTRRRADLERATFGLDSVTGLVSQVTSQNLMVEVDYSRLFGVDGPEGTIVSADPRGTSGGPVYRVTDNPEGPGLEIAGFIYEQSEQNRFLLARHAGAVRSDGTITAD